MRHLKTQTAALCSSLTKQTKIAPTGLLSWKGAAATLFNFVQGVPQ